MVCFGLFGDFFLSLLYIPPHFASLLATPFGRSEEGNILFQMVSICCLTVHNRNSVASLSLDRQVSKKTAS